MVLALSGKCCSGKNYISKIIESYGFVHIDVDKVSAEVFNTMTKEIIDIFGNDVVVNNIIDRKKVGEIIFSDKNKRFLLEAVIHPKVYERINEIINMDFSLNYLVNIPILNDEDFINSCSGIIWIKSRLITRIYRAIKRDNYSFITLIKRIFAQKKLSAKYLITNVDIYYIFNGWFSIRLKKDIENILNRVGRG